MPWGQFPLRPSFQSGSDLGFFIGRKGINNDLQLRWNGDGGNHYTHTSFMSSRALTNVSSLSLETDDSYIQGANYVEANMHIVNGADGLNIQGDTSALLGVTYKQDRLFSSNNVNSQDSPLGEPNAYRLPLATPYGKPDFDSSSTAGVFLWKDDGIWHLRLAAGGGFQRIIGTISSDSAITVTPYRLEPDDVLDNAIPTQINFNLGASNAWQDGIDFLVADGAVVTINFQSASGNANELIFIGKDKWPVSALPLNIGGW